VDGVVFLRLVPEPPEAMSVSIQRHRRRANAGMDRRFALLRAVLNPDFMGIVMWYRYRGAWQAGFTIIDRRP